MRWILGCSWVSFISSPFSCPSLTKYMRSHTSPTISPPNSYGVNRLSTLSQAHSSQSDTPTNRRKCGAGAGSVSEETERSIPVFQHVLLLCHRLAILQCRHRAQPTFQHVCRVPQASAGHHNSAPPSRLPVTAAMGCGTSTFYLGSDLGYQNTFPLVPYFSYIPSSNPHHQQSQAKSHPSETFIILSAVTSQILSQPPLTQDSLIPAILPRLRREWNAWVNQLDEVVNRQTGMFGGETVRGWERTLDELAEAKGNGLEVFRQDLPLRCFVQFIPFSFVFAASSCFPPHACIFFLSNPQLAMVLSCLQYCTPHFLNRFSLT